MPEGRAGQDRAGQGRAGLTWVSTADISNTPTIQSEAEYTVESLLFQLQAPELLRECVTMSWTTTTGPAVSLTGPSQLTSSDSRGSCPHLLL